jgi:hypothetical protein
VLVHLIVFNWAGGRIGALSLRDQQPTVITTELRSIPLAAEPVAATPPATRPAAPKPPPRRASKPPPPATPLAEAAAAVAPTEMEAPTDAAKPVTEVAAAEPPATRTDLPAASSSALAEASNTSSVQERKPYKVSPPPSVELKYDVQSSREGQQPRYGYGTISWQAEGSRYTITGEAGVLFLSFLNFRSEGMIDDYGVAPVIYSEKRFRRSETNTHFHRERNTISFSASAKSYPRMGGEQDRASIVWQLAGIGRGDSEQFTPDAEIELFVAGVRDAEPWRIRVLGREDVVLDAGKIAAWHVVRDPRPGSYDQKLDIWLAPEQEWYPVKLRYTETNGDYLDMALSKIVRLTAAP